LIDKKIPVFNQGKNIRAWIYVEDTCSAIETVMNKGKKGEIYNISTDNLLTNLDLTKKILNYMKKDDSCIEFTENHPKHDIRYAMNAEKIKNLGWSEQYNFDEALEFTINWYKKNPDWYKPLLNKVKK
jgi:dTDP-glucose 4,6-dehydratase